MRALLLLTAAVAFALTGCDSTGLAPVDAGGGGTTSGHDGSGYGHDGGSDSGNTGSDNGSGSDGSGSDGNGSDGNGGDGSDDAYVDVDPRQTYYRTHGDAPVDAPAVRLSDLGIAPGDVVCFTAVGDLALGPGIRASEQGQPLATVIFSADDVLSPDGQRVRVHKAVDAGDDVYTPVTHSEAYETDVSQDFDATSACVTVPEGAHYLFASVYDDHFGDNTLATGSDRFGLILKK